MQATITRSVPVVRSPRVMQLEGMFDVPPAKRSEQTWTVDLPLDARPWEIGLIVGPSGCGKSTIAKELFGDDLVAGFDWPEDRSIVDAFPAGLSMTEITGALSSVGFSSPPSWLRPYRCLSNGEQFRVTLARGLADARSLLVIDEFTSVVDRTVAQIGSAAIAKTIRRKNVNLREGGGRGQAAAICRRLVPFRYRPLARSRLDLRTGDRPVRLEVRKSRPPAAPPHDRPRRSVGLARIQAASLSEQLAPQVRAVLRRAGQRPARGVHVDAPFAQSDKWLLARAPLGLPARLSGRGNRQRAQRIRDESLRRAGQGGPLDDQSPGDDRPSPPLASLARNTKAVVRAGPRPHNIKTRDFTDRGRRSTHRKFPLRRPGAAGGSPSIRNSAGGVHSP